MPMLYRKLSPLAPPHPLSPSLHIESIKWQLSSNQPRITFWVGGKWNRGEVREEREHLNYGVRRRTVDQKSHVSQICRWLVQESPIQSTDQTLLDEMEPVYLSFTLFTVLIFLLCYFPVICTTVQSHAFNHDPITHVRQRRNFCRPK